MMCQILEVARSGFYAWIHKPLSDRAIENERLLELIRESYVASGRIYGSPRVFLDLREAGEQIGRRRVARIMRTHGIRAIRGYQEPRRTHLGHLAARRRRDCVRAPLLNLEWGRLTGRSCCCCLT
jgi:transposase InsO family protein